MVLKLAHTNLDIYKVSTDFVLECYKITKCFPADERFTLIQQIRRAALTVFLNIAEGFTRKSIAERIRFFQVSRGSLIEVDAAIDLSLSLGYCKKEDLVIFTSLISRAFQMLSAMIK